MRQKKNKGRQVTSGGMFNQPSGGNTILLTQAARWNRDISHYMRAVTEAERVDFPNRVKLYDLYSTILMDTHLTSALEKRKSAILASQIEFGRDGKPDDRIGEMLSSPWFLDFLDDLLDTIWWGNSLFQFKPDRDGWLTYDLVPRKHVEPVRRLIMRMQSDTHGTPWDDYPDMLFVGKPRNLGELIKDIPWVLYKRADVSDWAQFAELFGQPIREYTYNAGDDEARYNLVNDIFGSGGSAVYMHPEGSNMKLLEAGNKTGSSDLYNGLASFCNAEISKHILGNTLTTEAGEKGTQALGAVQKKGEDSLMEKDKRFVLNVLNYQMTDLFESFGIRVRGGKFSFVSPKNTNPTQRIDIITKLNSLGLPLDHDQLYEEFGLNKPDNYNALMAAKQKPDPEPDPESAAVAAPATPIGEAKAAPAKKSKPTYANLLNRFFGQAPEADKGALDW